MFDANMRYLPEGFKFFARVNSCKVGCKAHRLGVRYKDIIPCTMLEETHKNPCVRFHLPHGSLDIRGWGEEGGFDFGAEYEGNLTLGGFISEDSRSTASEILPLLKKGTARYKLRVMNQLHYDVVYLHHSCLWATSIRAGWGCLLGRHKTKPTDKQIRGFAKELRKLLGPKRVEPCLSREVL
jgi:hypothetical protein